MTPSPGSFFHGTRAALRGLKLASTSHEVRSTYLRLVAAVLLAATMLDILGVWTVLSWTSQLPAEAWWGPVLRIVAQVAGILMVLLIAPIFALFAVNLALPVLSERVFMAGLRQVSPARAAQLGATPGLPVATAARISLGRLVLFTILSIGIFVASLVPVVGTLAGPALQVWLATRAVGWELLDPYFDKLGLSRAEQQGVLATHRAAISGFALPCVALLAVPILGPWLFGLAQAATAVLVVDILERPSTKVP